MNKWNKSFKIIAGFTFAIASGVLSSEVFAAEQLCADASSTMLPAAKAKAAHYQIGRKAFDSGHILVNQEAALYIQGYCRTSVYPTLLYNRTSCPGGPCSDWFDVSYTYKKDNETASISQRIGLLLERGEGVLVSYKQAEASFGDLMTLQAVYSGPRSGTEIYGLRFRKALYKAFPGLPTAYTFTVSRVVCRQIEGSNGSECDFIRNGETVTLNDETADTVMQVFEEIKAPNISKEPGKVVRGVSLILVPVFSGNMGSPIVYRENLKSVE